MPEYILKIVSKFKAFDDIDARKISKAIVSSLQLCAPSLQIEVKTIKHGNTENIMKRKL